MTRPISACIDTRALRQNYRVACDLAPGSRNIAVVKANAYGHGAAIIARALDDLAPAFAVAGVDEALELRDAGISKPVLLLEGPFTPDEVGIAQEQGFWLMVCCREQVEMVCRANISNPVTVWLKIDSGMHRLGITEDLFLPSLTALSESANTLPGITLCTHLADAHNMSGRETAAQIAFFRRLVAGLDNPVSIANSAGLLHWPATHGAWNRPGLMLYGASPFQQPQENAARLEPVMTLQSAVIGVRKIAAGESVGYGSRWIAQRPSVIATVGVGYGDGYPRSAVDGTPVLLNGTQASLAGSVSMDMITVDATDLEDVKIGDPVELWGKSLPLAEVAHYAGTISHELVTRVSVRVPRVPV